MWKKWTKAVFAIAGLALVGRLLGFFRDALTARSFGASGTTDAYLFAMVILDLAFILNRTVVSTTVGHFGNSSPGSEAKIVLPSRFSKYLLFSAATLGIVVVGVIQWVVPHLLADLDPEVMGQFRTMAYVLLPTFVLITFAGMQSGVLQLVGRLDAPAALALFLNAFAIAFLVIGRSTLGIAALPWGFLLGVTGFVILQAWTLRKHSRATVVEQDLGRGGFRRWGLLSLSFFGAQTVSSVGIVTDRYFASLLPVGSYSIFIFASRVAQLPFSIVSYALSASLLPFQGYSRSRGRTYGLATTTGRGLLIGLIISGYAAVSLYVLASPVVRIVYEHGEFTHTDSQATACVLRLLALGIVPFILNPILANIAYVLGSPEALLKVGTVSAVFSTVTAWVLISVLASVNALAWSFSIGSWFYFWLLLLELKRGYGITFGRHFWLECLRVSICIAVAAAIGGLAHYPFAVSSNTDSFVLLLISTSVCGGMLSVVYALTLGLLFRGAIREILLNIRHH